MRIVVNADDFGLSGSTASATIWAFQHGGLSSATVMANMPATDRAISFARENPAYSFGAHLNFSEGTPLSPARDIPDLIDDEGSFIDVKILRQKLWHRKPTIEQFAIEAKAQLGKLRDSGMTISHVDSHGGVHKCPPILKALRQVLPQFGIHLVRNLQSLYVMRSRRTWVHRMHFLWRRSLLRSFSSTQHFFSADWQQGDQWCEDLMSKLSGTSLEIAVHPGWSGYQDAQRLASVKFCSLVKSCGHQVVPWFGLGKNWSADVASTAPSASMKKLCVETERGGVKDAVKS